MTAPAPLPADLLPQRQTQASAWFRSLRDAICGAFEALESEEEMREACRRIPQPMMANMADGGRTPIRSRTELQAMGYAMAIFPAATGLAAAAAAEQVLNLLKHEGTSLSPDVPLFNFSEFNSLIGFEEVWAFEKRWARPDMRTEKVEA